MFMELLPVPDFLSHNKVLLVTSMYNEDTEPWQVLPEEVWKIRES